MENIPIQIDEESTRPLTSKSPEEPSIKKKKTSFFTTTTGRCNSLRIILVCIACYSIAAAFFPSLLLINNRQRPASFQTVTSRVRSSDTSYEEDELAAQIPSCAKHTFLTLYRQQPHSGSAEERESSSNEKITCKGMLLRDDIILTTHECSQQSTLYFKSMSRGSVKATPYTALNANMALHSKLGFLQVQDVPYHYIFLDRPVRRARMFLSLRSNPGIAATADDDDFIHGDGDKDNRSSSGGSVNSSYITCKGYRPIVHNFPLPTGEMVPIGEELLTVGLPEDMLWEHADLETAPGLKNDDGERWWSKAITLKEGEAIFQEYIDKPELKGPEGSISVIRAHHGLWGMAGAISEVLDPRGHRREICFYNYVIRWKEEQPFSGMNFFDWVDYGTGKSLFERNMRYNFLPSLNDDMLGNVPEEGCVKRYFNSHTVHYFNDTERAAHEIYLSSSKDGQNVIARYKQSDEVVGPSSRDHPHLYMFDMKKRMYIVDKNIWDRQKYSTIKHTAVLNGRPALAAGEAYFKEDGAVWGINYDSGHYMPQIASATMMYQWVKDLGLDSTALYWMGRSSWGTNNCYETNWKGFDIRGFDARVLEKACLELTASSSWKTKKKHH